MAGRTRAFPRLRGRTVWLAGGFLLAGLMLPEIVSCVGRVVPSVGDDSDNRASGSAERTEQEAAWQVRAHSCRRNQNSWDFGVHRAAFGIDQ